MCVVAFQQKRPSYDSCNKSQWQQHQEEGEIVTISVSVGFVQGLFKVAGVALNSPYKLSSMSKAHVILTNLSNLLFKASFHPSIQSNSVSDWLTALSSGRRPWLGLKLKKFGYILRDLCKPFPLQWCVSQCLRRQKCWSVCDKNVFDVLETQQNERLLWYS